MTVCAVPASQGSWPVARLDEVAEVVSGVTKGRRFNGQRSLIVPYLRVANVQDGYLDLSEIKTIEALPSEVAALSLKRGDVLLTEGGDFDKLGRGAIWDHDIPNCIHQNHVFRVRLDQERLTSRFFAAYLLSPEAKSYFLRCAKRTTNLASISMTQLRALPVPLPPLPEQHRIVATLDAADHLRQLRAQADRRTSDLIPALFHQMFGDPLANEQAWRVLPVSSFVSEFQGGRSILTDGAESDDTKYRVLKVSAVTWRDYRPSESKPVPGDYQPPYHHLVRAGDLLFSRANTTELVGAVAFVFETPPNVLLSDKTWRFVWSEPSPVEPLFVRSLFQHPTVRQELGRRATGTSGSMQNISQPKVLSMRVAVPPLSLQQNFASRVAEIRALEAKQAESRHCLGALFQSLIHGAFQPRAARA